MGSKICCKYALRETAGMTLISSYIGNEEKYNKSEVKKKPMLTSVPPEFCIHPSSNRRQKAAHINEGIIAEIRNRGKSKIESGLSSNNLEIMDPEKLDLNSISLRTNEVKSSLVIEIPQTDNI